MTATFTTAPCVATDIGITAAEGGGEESVALIAMLDEYLSAFAKPVRPKNGSIFAGSSVCPNCGARLDGLIGSFQWGIVNGEGFCSGQGCGWPCRALHNIPSVFESRFQMILAYRPSVIKKADQHD